LFIAVYEKEQLAILKNKCTSPRYYKSLHKELLGEGDVILPRCLFLYLFLGMQKRKEIRVEFMPLVR